MAEKYLTLKLTITSLPKPTSAGCKMPGFRTRIEQSPLGASVGPGSDFEFDDSIQKQIGVVDFLQKMAKGSLSAVEVESFGKALFTLILRNEVLEKYKECVTEGLRSTATLRIALNIQPPELLGLPWEYLHDGKSHLLKKNFSIVRVSDELAQQDAPFGRIRSLLVVAAGPSKNSAFPAFDSDAHVGQLQAEFSSLSGLKIAVIPHVTADRLQDALRKETFDALYFVGHGRYSGSQAGQLILETDDGSDDPVRAEDFAQWLRNSKSVRFVYLNSCSTATTGLENPFSGAAQRLMLDGDVTAVVAMQCPIAQKAALAMAKWFFKYLGEESSPEEAVVKCRTQFRDSYSWGIPVVYTYLAGPEKLEQNRIACLLSAEPASSKYMFILPSFLLGLPAGDDPANIEQVRAFLESSKIPYSYPGEVFAITDQMAAFYLMYLVGRISPLTSASITTYEGFQQKTGQSQDVTHFFAFGSKSNSVCESLIKNYSKRFTFNFSSERWTINDASTQKSWSINDPSRQGEKQYRNSKDYGVIQKIVRRDQETTSVYFIIGGLGDRATQGCGWYFMRNWEALVREFGDTEFGIVLEFPENLNFTQGSRIL